MSEALPRETGSEKSGQLCPTCGTDLPAVRTPYGSVYPGACPNCTVEAGESQLEAQRAAACDDQGEPEGEGESDEEVESND